MPDGSGDAPGDLRALVERLLGEVESLWAIVSGLKAGRSTPGMVDLDVTMTRRTLPTDGDPVNMAALCEWVDSLVVRYASTGDWLRPCWWRHGFVVEELAALHVAWLAVFDAEQLSDPTAGVRWHEVAERCRERIRRTISVGPGCTAVSHRPDQPVTDDPRWADERAELHKLDVPPKQGTGPTGPP